MQAMVIFLKNFPYKLAPTDPEVKQLAAFWGDLINLRLFSAQ